MNQNKLNNSLDNFLNKNKTFKKLNNTDTEECDLVTGECHIMRTKDGIVEKLNKTFLTNDGRQLLQD